ncbi:MAG: hypothetical protein C5B56_08040 [Proteobacteria bacterium]|jgi:hypothetical protein|nr:MAG: hypothetical protein C5B56_08040 [Pseudomonadota bacterium]
MAFSIAAQRFGVADAAQKTAMFAAPAVAARRCQSNAAGSRSARRGAPGEYHAFGHDRGSAGEEGRWRVRARADKLQQG